MKITMKIELMIATVVLWSPVALSQSIEDMYFDVPAALIGLQADLSKETGQDQGGEVSKEQQKARILKLDNKNGYMELKGESGKQLAKFTVKGAGPILVMAETSYADGRTLSASLLFLTKRAGAWTDVTDEFLPKIPDLVINAFARDRCGVEIADSASGTYRYFLPQRGRTIRAVAESDVLTKPCRGDLFHLEMDSLKVGETWINRLVMKLVK